MKEIRVEHLAYSMKEAKKKNSPQPIFFLGAGASKSGGIPSASEIAEHILKDYADNPDVQSLSSSDRTYAKLMECLLPYERHELLKDYIVQAKINVTHIYLAQLLKEEWVDFILTVNFDNLILRALALFNIFPPTYDMAILKDLTTTTFKEKSVVYLHGQHHGLWLLNTDEELGKVAATVPRVFDSIKNKRPWVFIGYSGGDTVFDYIKGLGRFDNGLYWVTYKNEDPKDNVQKYLDEPNANAFILKGYDSDYFMIKLHSELGLDTNQPLILDKPFNLLKDMLEGIVDIDDEEHLKDVKLRLEISKRQVSEAIARTEDTSELDSLKKELINLIISEQFDDAVIKDIGNRASSKYSREFYDLLSSYYYSWGLALSNLSKGKEGEAAEALYLQEAEKYEKAIEIKSDFHEAYYNWGFALAELAKNKEGEEAETLYLQAFEKYKKAVEIKPDKHKAYYNWGAALSELARTKKDEVAEVLYLQAVEKFEKAVEIKPDKHKAYNNWGIALFGLAETKEGEEAEALYLQAFEKYEKAVEIKPDLYEAYNNWGFALAELAKNKEGEEAETLYLQAFEKFEKAAALGGSYYNLACLHALRMDREKALYCLGLCLSKQQISVSSVEKAVAWENYLQDNEFKEILDKYRNP